MRRRQSSSSRAEQSTSAAVHVRAETPAMALESQKRMRRWARRLLEQKRTRADQGSSAGNSAIRLQLSLMRALTGRRHPHSSRFVVRHRRRAASQSSRKGGSEHGRTGRWTQNELQTTDRHQRLRTKRALHDCAVNVVVVVVAAANRSSARLKYSYHSNSKYRRLCLPIE